ncbi:putative ABC transporter [Neohortaea acidophila]|uniref:Putative ABC transporter n=1 Tax=Neohortaea acidophila TaxID=245834 RepID=A0A6A6PM81_9PEZI|nr:putative ABC transporter [Neohortaea acidophila]KAF2481208.1 putative ABC transporter [Neohortaea acidophila]
MQQIPFGYASLGHHDTTPSLRNGTTYCFSHVWNDREARFETCFLPIVACVPAALAALVIFFQALTLLIPWRPRWTRPFVEEVYYFPVEDEFLPKRRWSPFVPALIVLSLAGFLLQSLVATATWFELGRLAPLATWFAVSALLFIYRPTTAPYSVLAILSLQAVVHVAFLVDDGWYRNGQEQNYGISTLVLSIVGIGVILIMPLRNPNLPTKDISMPMSEPTSSLRSPEDNLTLWQFLTVSWMTPLISIGYKRQLEDEDVWHLAYEFQHQRLHDNFRLLKGTVIRRLIKANAIDICILIVLGVLRMFLTYSPIVLLELLLSSMQDPLSPKRAAVTYAAISLVLRYIACQSGPLSLWYGRRCYERSRGEMITMLYEKTAGRKIAFAPDESEKTSSNGSANGHLNNEDSRKGETMPWWKRTWVKSVSMFKRKTSTPIPVKETASMGKILNLMRNDVYEIAQRFWEIQELVNKPLSVVLSIALVVRLLGWSSLLAVVAVVIAQAIIAILVRFRVHYERRMRAARDNRLQVVSQFVEAIRHLRWYGWQHAWLTKITAARQKELHLRIVLGLYVTVIGFINTLASETSPVIAFFAYTIIARKPLTVDVAFPAMQLSNMMIAALRDLPDLLNTIVNAYVAVGRIEDYMAEPDKPEMNTEALLGESVALERASFAWPGKTEPVLKNLDLEFPAGLTVVFGEVASGKTALLQSILGELDMLEGQLMRPNEPIGYCAQAPWLQSMSVRENILFSAPYEEQRYRTVLDACALVPDIAEFKAGDLSLVGENGIGLSGGQRARMALARALYSSANILLLDDPLSALDQQTAESIVQKCFAGDMLKGKTVVLVTHRTDLVLQHATQVIEIEEGVAEVIDRTTFVYHPAKRDHPSQPADETLSEIQPAEQPATVVPDKFMEDEYRAQGGVKASVYWEFVKAGKRRWWCVLIFVLAFYRLSNIAQAWFLKSWGEAYGEQSSIVLYAQHDGPVPTNAKPDFLGFLPPPDVDTNPWLLVFLTLALFECLSYLLFRVTIVVIMYTTAKEMFAAIMERVAGATFRFYDVTPVGRLMNRMTSDIGVIDGNISMQLHTVVWLGISWITALITVGAVTPSFLAFTALLTLAFVMIFLRFIPTSQSLRRLEMVSLTPLMSNFGALLQGLTTVRAFRVQQQFQDRVVRVVDTFQKMDHFYWSLQAWMMYRYEVLAATATFVVTMIALATNLSAGLTAFVLYAASKLVGTTHSLCIQYGQLQMEFVSVERVVELKHLEQEPKGSISPPAWWPSFSGDLHFDDVTIRYAPHLDPALKGISFTVKGGSKTAVIGRTGSGKSTLALSMLATIVPEAGKISLDNVDLAEVDRQLLRTRITFVAQDPILFPGTMRENLDPVQQHSDAECELVLERVCARQDWTLDTKVEAGGRNLSQGQRQLVGLARAVLRRSAIIILDEATASIDRETAAQIQQVMYEEMKESTVITIAHRLEAVMHADYCIVLGKGRILRQGTAAEMLEKTGVEEELEGDAEG